MYVCFSSNCLVFISDNYGSVSNLGSLYSGITNQQSAFCCTKSNYCCFILPERLDDIDFLLLALQTRKQVLVLHSLKRVSGSVLYFPSFINEAASLRPSSSDHLNLHVLMIGLISSEIYKVKDCAIHDVNAISFSYPLSI